MKRKCLARNNVFVAYKNVFLHIQKLLNRFNPIPFCSVPFQCQNNKTSPFTTTVWLANMFKIEVNSLIITNLYNCLEDQSYKMSLCEINYLIFILPLVVCSSSLKSYYVFICTTNDKRIYCGIRRGIIQFNTSATKCLKIM